MKKQISQETLCMLEDYGIELTPEIEAILTKDQKPTLEAKQEATMETATAKAS